MERHRPRQQGRAEQQEEHHTAQARQRAYRPRQHRQPLAARVQVRAQHTATTEDHPSRSARSLQAVLRGGVLGLDPTMGQHGHLARRSDLPTGGQELRTSQPVCFERLIVADRHLAKRVGANERTGAQPRGAATTTQSGIQRRTFEDQFVATIGAMLGGVVGQRHAHALHHCYSWVAEFGDQPIDDVDDRHVAGIDEKEVRSVDGGRDHAQAVAINGIGGGVHSLELAGEGRDRRTRRQIDQHHAVHVLHPTQRQQCCAHLVLVLIGNTHHRIDGIARGRPGVGRTPIRRRPQRPREHAGGDEPHNFHEQRRQREPQIGVVHGETNSPHEVDERRSKPNRCEYSRTEMLCPPHTPDLSSLTSVGRPSPCEGHIWGIGTRRHKVERSLRVHRRGGAADCPVASTPRGNRQT